MMAAIKQGEGGARGWPRLLLRLEGLGVLVLCAFLYHQTGLSWWWFAGLFLTPDLSFLAYGLGRGAGPWPITRPTRRSGRWPWPGSG